MNLYTPAPFYYRLFPEGSNRWIVLFFLGYFIFGLTVVDDYGLGWDEQFDRIDNGATVYNFVVHGEKQAYLDCAEKYHGPAIQLPLFALERLFQLNDSRNVHVFRHTCTFILFFVSSIAFYHLIRRLYPPTWIAFIAVVFYVFSPRIFADSFYNSKDLGFLSVFTLALYAGWNWLDKRTTKTLILFGFSCGFLISVRITGLVLPLITTAFYVLYDLRTRDSVVIVRSCFHAALLLVVTTAITIVCWPILWLGPVEQFVAAWKEMSHFGWHSNTLFLGKMVYSDELPWYYLPVWMGITIPVLVLFLFCVALPLLCIRSLRAVRKLPLLEWSNLYLAAIFLAPVLAILLLHSVLYDGWRHVFFLHAPLTALAVYPLYLLAHWLPTLQRYIAPAVIVLMLPVFARMSVLHPLENLYFNRLFLKDLNDVVFRYEMDYWGLSNRQLLSELLKRDPRGIIHIKPEHFPSWFNREILTREDRARLTFVSSENDADYFIGFYRWKTTPYTGREEVFSVWVDSVRIATCFKAVHTANPPVR